MREYIPHVVVPRNHNNICTEHISDACHAACENAAVFVRPISECSAYSKRHAHTNRHTHAHTQHVRELGPDLCSGKNVTACAHSSYTYDDHIIIVCSRFARMRKHANVHDYTNTHSTTHTHTNTHSHTQKHTFICTFIPPQSIEHISVTTAELSRAAFFQHTLKNTAERIDIMTIVLCGAS